MTDSLIQRLKIFKNELDNKGNQAGWIALLDEAVQQLTKTDENVSKDAVSNGGDTSLIPVNERREYQDMLERADKTLADTLKQYRLLVQRGYYLSEPKRESVEESGQPYLHNGGDGVNGHYCIARYNIKGKFSEFWSKNKWCSAGEVFKLGNQIEGGK